MRRVNITGRTFGRLTALREDGRIGSQLAWLCSCSCGATVRSTVKKLNFGNTRSCGCLKRDTASARQRRHGHKGNPRKGERPTPEYCAWRHIIDRCENPRSKYYAIYGGRGIRVCPVWRESFEAFLADVGNRPDPGLSLDRVDVDGDYAPGNVRWATATTQQRNKRNNVIVTLNGEQMTRADAADRIGWPYMKLRDRMRKAGTTIVDDVLTGVV